MSSKTNAFNAYESQLNGGITDSATSLTVDAAGGMVHPAYLVIEPQDATLREVIKVGNIAGTTFSSLTRGLAGSVSGAQAHNSGAIIRSVPVHQELDDIYTDIIALEAADSGHFGGTDTADHPEVTGSTRGFMTAADKTALDADPPHTEDHASRHLPAGGDPITTANASAIETANAEGTNESLSRSDHIHKIHNARLVAIDGDAGSTNINSGLTTSLVDKLTLDFVMPIGWNTALIIARGSMMIHLSGQNGNLEYRIEIGSDNGLTMVHDPISGGHLSLVASHNVVVSGNVTIAYAARKTNSGDTFNFKSGEVSAIWIRAS